MAPATSARSILIIDDDDDMAHALGCVLERAGYRVRHAADGDVGVAMAAQEQPDLILLDLMMPTKNGFEACSELKGNESLRKVPILVMTAFGQDIGEIHGMARANAPPNIQGYMEKPIEPNLLLDQIEIALCRDSSGP